MQKVVASCVSEETIKWNRGQIKINNNKTRVGNDLQKPFFLFSSPQSNIKPEKKWHNVEVNTKFPNRPQAAQEPANTRQQQARKVNHTEDKHTLSCFKDKQKYCISINIKKLLV